MQMTIGMYGLLFIVISFGGITLYLTFRLIIFRKEISQSVNYYPSISIVIPFRNEALHLPSLLASLANQDYQGSYEIILVDDQSTDAFIAPLQSFRNTYPDISVTVIHSDRDRTLHLTSKQQALDEGVARAAFEWIAFTDADMYLHTNWLTSLMTAAGRDTSLVYGHTIIRKEKRSFFERFQSFQLEFLFAAAFSFHTAGLRGSCMGNNLLFSKKMYLHIGGQKGIGYSIVEDLDLLRIAMQKGFKAIPATPFRPNAETQSCTTIAQFYNQALRWLKGGLKQPFTLFPVLFLLGSQNIILFLALLRLFPLPILIGGLCNILLLFLFIIIAFRKIGSPESTLFFPVYYIFMVIQTIVMIIPVVTLAPVWKKREI